MNFTDQTVLITGAGAGIGRGIALAFGRVGARVVVNYVVDPEEAEAVVTTIREAGGEAIALAADISDYAQAEALVQQTIATYGAIDILINNAGITRDHLMLKMDEKMFDDVIAVNLKGTWNMCKHVTRPMLKQKSGAIINIASVVGLIGNAGQANYVASKAGVIGLTKTLAKEFGKKNVRVNAVAPGFIETRMTETLPPAVKEHYLAQIPLNRFGTVEDVVDAVLFLASDKATYITGQVINVNGGMIG
ncbi:MAG: 3-oxoacyl-[acyl-carrier-protein] reductase [Acholeplasmatales bacterium]|nr:MAG: 3-oxoacyl-[acyl-carrier-protein] reductase [Acholeplasmatales bacterium]